MFAEDDGWAGLAFFCRFLVVALSGSSAKRDAAEFLFDVSDERGSSAKSEFDALPAFESAESSAKSELDFFFLDFVIRGSSWSKIEMDGSVCFVGS